MTNEKRLKIVGHRREQSRTAPDQGADDHDSAALETIGERSNERRRTHVTDDESGSKKSELGVGAMEFRLDQRLYREQHRPVNVIHEVKGRKNEEGPASAAVAHAWEDYKSA